MDEWLTWRVGVTRIVMFSQPVELQSGNQGS
jgi:hypothetical protein